MRGRGLAGFGSIAGGEDFGWPGDVAGAPPDFDERADDRSDHIVQEAVAGDFDGDAVLVGESFRDWQLPTRVSERLGYVVAAADG